MYIKYVVIFLILIFIELLFFKVDHACNNCIDIKNHLVRNLILLAFLRHILILLIYVLYILVGLQTKDSQIDYHSIT